MYSASIGPLRPWVDPRPTADSVTTQVPGAPDLVFAGPAARLVACIIDAAVLFLLGVIAVSVATVLTHDPNAAAANYIVATSVLLSLPFALYFWTGGHRGTPGQRLLAIQVGSGVAGGLSAVIPALLGPVVLAVAGWSVVLLVTVFLSPTRQGLHDRIAGTAVVRARDASNRLVVGGLIVIVAGPVLLLLLFVSLLSQVGY